MVDLPTFPYEADDPKREHELPYELSTAEKESLEQIRQSLVKGYGSTDQISSHLDYLLNLERKLVDILRQEQKEAIINKQLPDAIREVQSAIRQLRSMTDPYASRT